MDGRARSGKQRGAGVTMAKIIPLHRPSPAKIGCSSCGATVDAACDCGAPYLPAGQRAAEAVAANPEKSNRAIAADIGVDHKTVAKARGDNSPPERVTGKWTELATDLEQRRDDAAVPPPY